MNITTMFEREIKKMICIKDINQFEKALDDFKKPLSENDLNVFTSEFESIFKAKIYADIEKSKTERHTIENMLINRVNNNIVNGKPVSLTRDEIKIFNHTLKGYGQKTGSFQIHI